MPMKVYTARFGRRSRNTSLLGNVESTTPCRWSPSSTTSAFMTPTSWDTLALECHLPSQATLSSRIRNVLAPSAEAVQVPLASGSGREKRGRMKVHMVLVLSKYIILYRQPGDNEWYGP